MGRCRWQQDSPHSWPQTHDARWAQKTLLQLSFFSVEESWDKGISGISKPLWDWLSFCKQGHISPKLFIFVTAKKRICPKCLLIYFSPNYFIMPNLLSLEGACYCVQILFKLLYWHRNKRCLIYIVIFGKRDVCIFESVMISVASQWGFLAYDVALQRTERKGSSSIH